ncbi:MtrB/PioB family decaheme-associated outer membrane protein [Shewanella sp. Isolate11]|uniref:MtrB/PioB family decaheme-associated outer membrane protein n=1 Tax=Shewanella sp. Isolate11 TaxID=2908530 RepID=UPI001EFE5923|nr:MtrB/PioB family decaheme-associated outer membrane protein [Shewanella sp. Isolate11]MCG9696212.1 MtrB/PioB family decaheme-associated outer membrane protein [Shewanella sp. Isolate11]
MKNHNGHRTLPIKLSAITLAIMSSMAYADGYGIASANRESLKQDGWDCKRCELKTGTQGTIGVGVASNDGEDSRFGNTTGTDEDGFVASVEADVSHLTESGYQTRFNADKLGYDNGSADLTTGRRGQYSINASYRGITRYDTNSAMSPFSRQNNQWLLPSQWQSAATTDQMSDLQTAAMPIELKIARDRFNLGADYNGSFYKANIDYQHEQREGYRTSSANLLSNSVQLAQRVDDSTDNVTSKFYLRGDSWLAGIDAGVSYYRNDEESLYWQSPFSPTFGAAYFGQNAVAPDNKAYRIAGNSQFSSDGQQVLMHVGFTRMTQDQAFLPATINGPSPVLPNDNLDGQVDILEMKLNYSGRLTQDLSLRASYDYRDRDNKTEFDSYPQVITDSFYSGDATPAEYDRTRQQAAVAAKYRFSRAIYLDVGYDYDYNTYSDLDRQTLRENSIYGKLNYRITSQWLVWLKASGSDRSGSEYMPVTTTASPSNPLLRKSYLADRERQQYGLYASYSAGSLGVTANLHWMQDDYNETLIGLTEVETQGYDLSANYAINDNISLNAFVNQDWRDSDQAGSSNFGTPNWFATAEEQSTLIGTGINYGNLMDNKLNLGLDYTYSDGQSDTQVTQGLQSPYGDYYSTKHNVNAFARYQVSEAVGLRFDWIYEQYQDTDWANQGLTLDAIPNVLSFGDLSHDYSSHYFGLTLSYQL